MKLIYSKMPTEKNKQGKYNYRFLFLLQYAMKKHGFYRNGSYYIKDFYQLKLKPQLRELKTKTRNPELTTFFSQTQLNTLIRNGDQIPKKACLYLWAVFELLDIPNCDYSEKIIQLINQNNKDEEIIGYSGFCLRYLDEWRRYYGIHPDRDQLYPDLRYILATLDKVDEACEREGWSDI